MSELLVLPLVQLPMDEMGYIIIFLNHCLLTFSAAVKAAGTVKVERTRLISPVERLIWRMSRDANGRVNPVSRAKLA